MANTDIPNETLSIDAEIGRADALRLDGRADEAERVLRGLLAKTVGSFAAATPLMRLLDGLGRRNDAIAILQGVVAADASHTNVMTAARHWQEWDTDPNASLLRTVRIGLVGSGTLDSVAAYLRVQCGQAGLHALVHTAAFGQWAQEILSADSSLYRIDPQIVIIALQPADIFRAVVTEINKDTNDIDAGLHQIEELVAAVHRQAPEATVVLHNFPVPDYSPLGILDAAADNGQRAQFARINGEIAERVRKTHPYVVIFDAERVESRYGKSRVRDDRMWYLASIPYSNGFLTLLASEYMRIIRALLGLTRKCIVLDLDNTLWGGVVGEDGFEGIHVGGSTAPGNAYADFQRALLALQRRGVLLAICSKNNPDDALPVLEKHPGMILRRTDFAATQIGWQQKSAGIRAIAAELNIGLDSLVFLDDSPAERAEVRAALPQVTVVDLPRDPALYTRALNELNLFDSLALTNEDRERGRLYRQQEERKAYEEAVSADATTEGQLNAYLYGLEMVVRISVADSFMVPRIAQLTNKTNQFNVTTRRYTEAQIRAMAGDDHWIVYVVHVSDKFGDSGLTGVALVRAEPLGVLRIDSLLLSCRVLARGVEDALMTRIERDAAAAGAQRIVGEFFPTPKNAPAADFFAKQGFTPTGPQGTFHGGQEWSLDLAERTPRPYPAWLTIVE